MAIGVRSAGTGDVPFLREMLFHAIYWRAIQNNENPPPGDVLSMPNVCVAYEAWGRPGDTGVIATDHSTSVGAAWYRLYEEERSIRGYLDDTTPVVVIAVAEGYRRQGIATLLVEKLIEQAIAQGVPRLSLMVAVDNHAFGLYRKCGFVVSAEVEDARLMVLDL